MKLPSGSKVFSFWNFPSIFFGKIKVVGVVGADDFQDYYYYYYDRKHQPIHTQNMYRESSVVISAPKTLQLLLECLN